MRIACVHVPRFHVQVERLKNPGLEGFPVIIGGRPGERAPVIDCSEEAEQRGVRPSLTMKEACRLCPDAFFTHRVEEGESGGVWGEVVSMLRSFSMRIETLKEGTACLDITKILNIYENEEALATAVVREIKARFRLEAKAGVGNSRFIARTAASMARPCVRVVPPGREREFVAPLPVALLPVDEEVRERLVLLGIHRMERVASLPAGPLVAQFGRAGRVIRDISEGAGEDRPIPRSEGELRLEREVVSETPIEGVERLRAFLDRSVGEIGEELVKMRRLCRVIGLVLHLLNGKMLEKRWIMHAPTSSREEMVRKVMDGLGAVALESPVKGFIVSVCALSKREPVPDMLFRMKTPGHEGLKGVKEYLKAKYGRPPLVKVVEGDPDSRLPERRFVFVEL